MPVSSLPREWRTSIYLGVQMNRTSHTVLRTRVCLACCTVYCVPSGYKIHSGVFRYESCKLVWSTHSCATICICWRTRLLPVSSILFPSHCVIWLLLLILLLLLSSKLVDLWFQDLLHVFKSKSGNCVHGTLVFWAAVRGFTFISCTCGHDEDLPLCQPFYVSETWSYCKLFKVHTISYIASMYDISYHIQLNLDVKNFSVTKFLILRSI